MKVGTRSGHSKSFLILIIPAERHGIAANVQERLKSNASPRQYYVNELGDVTLLVCHFQQFHDFFKHHAMSMYIIRWGILISN